MRVKRPSVSSAQLRQAEVHEHRLPPLAAEHDVARLDVAMDDAGLVQGMRRLRRLPDQLHHGNDVPAPSRPARGRFGRDDSWEDRLRAGRVLASSGFSCWRCCSAALLTAVVQSSSLSSRGRAACQLPADRRQIDALDQFHGVEPLLALAAGGEHLHQVRMLHLAQRPDLAREARLGLGIAACETAP